MLILPASIYTFTSVTARDGGTGNTQGGTQGFANVNPTGTYTGSHNNPHISTDNASARSTGNSSIATATGNSSIESANPGNPNTATVNGDSSSP